jgi:hypothetical protein
MNSIGKEAAIKLYESGWWKGKSAEEIVDVQLFTDELVIPFGDFHAAVEKALGRPVWTHEFGSTGYEHIVKEYLGDEPAPTMEQILALVPADKLIVIGA